MTNPCPGDPRRYDPWTDLAARWPEVGVVREPMVGRLLGELRYPVIALRAASSAAQQRCTLAHEIVHLDRGGTPLLPVICSVAERWTVREEAVVHAEAARRLITVRELLDVLRVCGPAAVPGAVADALHVDTDTLLTRVAALTPEQRARVDSALRRGG